MPPRRQKPSSINADTPSNGKPQTLKPVSLNGKGNQFTPSPPSSTSSTLTPPSSPPRVSQTTLVPETSQASGSHSDSSQTVIGSPSKLKRKRSQSVEGSVEPVVSTDQIHEDDEEDEWDPASWVRDAQNGGKLPKKDDVAEVHEDEAQDAEERLFVPTQLPLSYQNLEDKPALLVRKERNYFPAYLSEFQAAQNYDEEDIFIIVQHAVTKKHGPQRVKRKNIILLEDDELADCPLAIIDTTAKKFSSDARTRAATPETSGESISNIPLPSRFAEMERSQQIRLIRPHLQSVINDEYEPALSRTKQFFKSDKSRQAMSRKIIYGDIPVAEAKDVILPELERWALRDQRFTQSELVDKPELDPIRPPTGSDRYNNLSTEEQRKYIPLILQPEAIIQLAILSYGPQFLLESAKSRKSHLVEKFPDITVGDVGEKLLYLLAEDHLEELSAGSDISIWTSIDDDIKDARKAMRERLGLSAEGKSKTELEAESRIGKEMVWATGRYIKKVDYTGDGTGGKK